MARISLDRTDRPGIADAVRRRTEAILAKLTALALRFNGTAVPKRLDEADRAELERTIFG